MSIEPVENPGRLVPLRSAAHDPDRTPAPADDPGADAGDGRAADTAGGNGITGALGVVVGVSLAAVIIAPVTLSAQHLITWASSPTGLALQVYFAWIVFLALDLAAVTCIGMVTLCAKRGEGAGGFKVGTWAFAFGSAAANYSGGHGAGKVFFPAMSIAGPMLLEMVLAKVKRWARIAEETQISARPKFGIRWVPGIAFKETRRAWAAARRENIAKVSDAIAFVREVDVLKRMSDDDAVAYAQAAVHTGGPYELRQWLTSRGKDVTQTALPLLSQVSASATDDDIAREGAPMSEMFAPMPKAIRAPREALGLPPAPEPVRAAQRPKGKAPALPPRRVKGDPTSNPRWDKGVTDYRQSIEQGNPMSQHELAAHMGMKNRTLAAQIIAHVRREG